MPKNQFVPSPHKEEAKQALRYGASIEEVAKRFNISERTVWRYNQEIKKEDSGNGDKSGSNIPVKPPPAKKAPTGAGAYQEGGKVVAITTPKPAAVNFYIGSQQIELDAECLYESFLLYQDIKARCQLTDSFGGVLRDGVGLLWKILVNEPQVERGEVKVEVINGRSNGLS